MKDGIIDPVSLISKPARTAGLLMISLLMTLMAVSCKQKESRLRTQYFPKTEQKGLKLPKADHLWVFILAGQSNMAGRGFVEPQDTIPSDRIFTINKSNEIIIAKEPLHFYEPALTGLDCGLSFGKELVKSIPDSISILLLPAAVGGSSISQWIGDSIFRNVQLFSNLAEKVKIGKEHGIIKGILWHQGENDATNVENIALYKTRLFELLKKLRDTVGDESLPVLIGELGQDNEDCEKIDTQIKLYISTDCNASFVKTSDLKKKEDHVHFNSKGLRTLGKRFAVQYLEVISRSDKGSKRMLQ